ncbi:hypothetical protein FHT87_005198 [Rhizobium sp. BK316]|nr:hypothetical protein [Rhizobium sp. BK316]
MGWPDAFATVGVAASIAAFLVAFFICTTR